MREEIVYIKNMATPRCIILVRTELENLGAVVKQITIGSAAFLNKKNVPIDDIAKALTQMGFEVVANKDKHFTEQVKLLILGYLDVYLQGLYLPKLSVYLEKKLRMKYSKINEKFIVVEGDTIIVYFNKQRIERKKRFLLAKKEKRKVKQKSFSFGELRKIASDRAKEQSKEITKLFGTEMKDIIKRSA